MFNECLKSLGILFSLTIYLQNCWQSTGVGRLRPSQRKTTHCANIEVKGNFCLKKDSFAVRFRGLHSPVSLPLPPNGRILVAITKQQP